MFTGLIEELGYIEQIKLGRDSAKLSVRASKVLDNTEIGDSIAVNGVCLTVVSLSKGSFTADVMAETLKYSNLGDLKIGDAVNLERALSLKSRLGGHIVSGHIDGVGYVEQIEKHDIATLFTIKVPSELADEIVKKGSIGLDGISLTVTNVTKDTFSISAIPHSLEETTLAQCTKGRKVNIETDIIGKYVKKMLGLNDKKEIKQDILTKEFLLKNGF